MKTVTAILIVLLLGVAPIGVAAQDHAPAPAIDVPQGSDSASIDAHAPGAGIPSDDHATEGADHGEGGPLELIAKLFNFAVLVGILVYFLRQPIATYLVDRHSQIRQALVAAAATREQAAADLRTIETRLAALPAELEALKARGADDVRAEQARIKATAATERERLLQQTRREIEQQYRLARRALVHETAEQAAGIARARIERDITPADQARLVDRYLTQVRA